MTNNYFGKGVAERYDSDETVAFDRSHPASC